MLGNVHESFHCIFLYISEDISYYVGTEEKYMYCIYINVTLKLVLIIIFAVISYILCGPLLKEISSWK